MRALIALGAIAGVAILAVPWMKQPPLPYCERYQIYQVDGNTYLIDAANLKKLLGVLNGMRDGTCRPDDRLPGKKTNL